MVGGIAGPVLGLIAIYLIPSLWSDYEEPEDILFVFRCAATFVLPLLLLWSLYKLLEWQREGKPAKESIQRIKLDD